MNQDFDHYDCEGLKSHLCTNYRGKSREDTVRKRFQDSKGNDVVIQEYIWFLKSHLLSHKVIPKWAGISPVWCSTKYALIKQTEVQSCQSLFYKWENGRHKRVMWIIQQILEIGISLCLKGPGEWSQMNINIWQCKK